MTGSRIFFVFVFPLRMCTFNVLSSEVNEIGILRSTYGVLSERNVCEIWLKGELKK